VNAPRGQCRLRIQHHTFSLWNNYQVHRRAAAALGVVSRSQMFATIDNSVLLPGYTRVDAAGFVTLTSRFRVQVNVENLFRQEVLRQRGQQHEHYPWISQNGPGGPGRDGNASSLPHAIDHDGGNNHASGLFDDEDGMLDAPIGHLDTPLIVWKAGDEICLDASQRVSEAAVDRDPEAPFVWGGKSLGMDMASNRRRFSCRFAIRGEKDGCESEIRRKSKDDIVAGVQIG